jgi:hypothetical protein
MQFDAREADAAGALGRCFEGIRFVDAVDDRLRGLAGGAGEERVRAPTTTR